MNITSPFPNHFDIIILNEMEYKEVDSKHILYIKATYPVLVAQFSKSFESDYNRNSDPFMVIIPPVSQYSDIVSFAPITPLTLDSDNQFVHYITLWTTDKEHLHIDCGSVSSYPEWEEIPSIGYSTLSTEIDIGYHMITDSFGVPFGAIVYGFRRQESYGYPLRSFNQASQDLTNCNPETIESTETTLHTTIETSMSPSTNTPSTIYPTTVKSTAPETSTVEYTTQYLSTFASTILSTQDTSTPQDTTARVTTAHSETTDAIITTTSPQLSTKGSTLSITTANDDTTTLPSTQQPTTPAATTTEAHTTVRIVESTIEPSSAIPSTETLTSSVSHTTSPITTLPTTEDIMTTLEVSTDEDPTTTVVRSTHEHTTEKETTTQITTNEITTDKTTQATTLNPTTSTEETTSIITPPFSTELPSTPYSTTVLPTTPQIFEEIEVTTEFTTVAGSTTPLSSLVSTDSETTSVAETTSVISTVISTSLSPSTIDSTTSSQTTESEIVMSTSPREEITPECTSHTSDITTSSHQPTSDVTSKTSAEDVTSASLTSPYIISNETSFEPIESGPELQPVYMIIPVVIILGVPLIIIICCVCFNGCCGLVRRRPCKCCSCLLTICPRFPVQIAPEPSTSAQPETVPKVSKHLVYIDPSVLHQNTQILISPHASVCSSKEYYNGLLSSPVGKPFIIPRKKAPRTQDRTIAPGNHSKSMNSGSKDISRGSSAKTTGRTDNTTLSETREVTFKEPNDEDSKLENSDTDILLSSSQACLTRIQKPSRKLPRHNGDQKDKWILNLRNSNQSNNGETYGYQFGAVDNTGTSPRLLSVSPVTQSAQLLPRRHRVTPIKLLNTYSQNQQLPRLNSKTTETPVRGNNLDNEFL